MARGWESKSVEAQIESVGERRARSANQLMPEQVETERKLDSLLLHRTRVMRDIELSKDDRYRTTLNAGLKYLETELSALGWRAS